MRDSPPLVTLLCFDGCPLTPPVRPPIRPPVRPPIENPTPNNPNPNNPNPRPVDPVGFGTFPRRMLAITALSVSVALLVGGIAARVLPAVM